MARRVGPAPIADEILFVPESAFYGSEPLVPNPRPKRKRRRFVVEEPMVRPFGDFESFQVRTALLRPRNYRPADAPVVDGPVSAAALCRHMAYYDQEHMVVLALNVANRLMAIFEAAIGGTSGIQIQTKHMLKVPLLTNASAAIVAHNHPSGSRSPSAEDQRFTQALGGAFSCVGIELLDSLVISTEGWYSIMQAERAPWPDEG